MKEKLGNACKEIFGQKSMDWKVENILCKIGRKIRNSDQLYTDLVDEKFPFVTYNNGKVTFETVNEILFTLDKRMIRNMEQLKQYQHSFNDKWMKKLK